MAGRKNFCSTSFDEIVGSDTTNHKGPIEGNEKIAVASVALWQTRKHRRSKVICTNTRTPVESGRSRVASKETKYLFTV